MLVSDDGKHGVLHQPVARGHSEHPYQLVEDSFVREETDPGEADHGLRGDPAEIAEGGGQPPDRADPGPDAPSLAGQDSEKEPQATLP